MKKIRLYQIGFLNAKKCGIEIDRDLNAALNIERVGVDILYNRTQRDEVANPVEVSRTE